jgi:hypothetical protein
MAPRCECKSKSPHARIPGSHQPPHKVAAGEGFVIPAGVVHNAKNDSATAVKLVGV